MPNPSLRPVLTLSLLLTSLLLMPATATQEHRWGILDKPAPPWKIDSWVQLADGQKIGPEIAQFKGKVIYLYCFQSWCPGCHAHGFPTLQKMIAHYKDDPQVAFVALQTTFEGHAANSAQKAKATAERYQLKIPVGHTQGTEGRPPQFMFDYRTGGTPWTAIIDGAGIVRFNDFHVDFDQAVKLINDLKDKATKE